MNNVFRFLGENMNKNYGLVAAIFIGFSGGLIASEDTKPSFVESTKEDLKIASILYGAVYTSVHITANLCVPIVAYEGISFEICWERAFNDKKFSFGEKASIYKKELKEAFFKLNKGVLKSHLVVAPAIVTGVVAHNLYKKVSS
jgi:hypothetical protein